MHSTTQLHIRKTAYRAARQFRNDDKNLVMAAVEAFIATDIKGFAPSIGAIKDKMATIKAAGNGELTELEAWGLVMRALENSGYNYAQEFAKLPPVVQRCIGEPLQLHYWALMDIDTVNSVVASNFQRSYRARAAHVRELEKLPENVKALYGAVGDAFRMPRLPEAPKTPLDDLPEIGEVAIPEHFLAKGRELKENCQRMEAEAAKARVRQIFGDMIGKDAADRYFEGQEAGAGG